MRKYELKALDDAFLSFLGSSGTNLLEKLLEKRRTSFPISSVEIFQISQVLEDFLIDYFNVDIRFYKERLTKMEQKVFVKKNFVQRKVFAHFKHFEGEIPTKMTEEEFVLKVLSGENEEELKHYARFVLFTEEGKAWHKGQTTFNLPKPITKPFKITEEGRAIYEGEGEFFLTEDENFWMANYCIHCHKQKRDYCRTENPFSHTKGCPLDQKISEMNLLKSKGLIFAPLAVMMIDNPLCILTGHRICNDCKKACIFQKQTPVDVPSVETQILLDVLNLPFGFEFYFLLTQWNPLLTKNFLPNERNGKKILVCGAGPSGILSSYYSLKEGFDVLMIDGLKLARINHEGLIENINQISRKIKGFGGVMEYGITERWNKNLLALTQILLERMAGFEILGGKKFGTDITFKWAKNQGFIHVFMCIGAGMPNLPKNFEVRKGVFTASNFLMSMHLEKEWQEKNVKSPVLVVGSGLTAMDVCLLAKKRGLETLLFSRGKFENSRAFKGNELELEDVLASDVKAFEEREFCKIYGDFALFYNKITQKEEVFPFGSLVFALGTSPNLNPIAEENFEDTSFFSIMGDLDKNYEGSVVKALASVKNKKDEIFNLLHGIVKKQEIAISRDEILSISNHKNLIRLEIMPSIMPESLNVFDVYKLQILEEDCHTIPLTLFEWTSQSLIFYIKPVGDGTKKLTKNCKILLTKSSSCKYKFDKVFTDDEDFVGLAGAFHISNYEYKNNCSLFYVKNINSTKHLCKPHDFIFLFPEMNCMLSGVCSRCLRQKADGTFFYSCKENIIQINELS